MHLLFIHTIYNIFADMLCFQLANVQYFVLILKFSCLYVLAFHFAQGPELAKVINCWFSVNKHNFGNLLEVIFWTFNMYHMMQYLSIFKYLSNSKSNETRHSKQKLINIFLCNFVQQCFEQQLQNSYWLPYYCSGCLIKEYLYLLK